MALTLQMRDKISAVARRLSIPPEWLQALIDFETGGTFSPEIKNPNSSARGLIQLTDGAAVDLGFASSFDAVQRYPDFDSQMDGIVYPYLARYAPFNDKQSLYMAVFYPAYRTASPDTVFSETIRAVNPGIDTVSDYINFVDRRIKEPILAYPKRLALPLILFIGAGLYYWNKK